MGVSNGVNEWVSPISLTPGVYDFVNEWVSPISLTPGVYDFTQNPRSWYGSWFKYAVRNIETYLGFYVASHAGNNQGTDYTIKYQGQPNVILPKK